ncbi:MAG: HD domain-containing protein, partial [Bdellovibrionota bacterium]
MATKSFLSPTELSEAEVKLRSPARVPDGDEKKTSDFHSFDFSNWLGEKLLARLSAHPSFDEAGPIALGSWARGELAPKADIDMIFCGNEEAVSNLVRDFAAQGLKLRYRMPEDMRDWSVGVLPFDVLALLHAKPLTEDAAEKLKSAQAKILEKGSAFKKSLTRAMTEERKTRAKRFDSISNYLEPNLKYGPGGMRDLEQALVIRALYPERFTEVGLHAFDVLRYYKAFFLLVRHRLHLGEGTGDLLIATEQKAIAEWLGFKDARDFMREIQKGVSRVSFYADWTIEQATKPRTTIQRVAGKKLEKVESLFDALTDDHSVLMQNRVRLSADHVFSKYGKSERLKVRKTIGRKLTKFIDPSGDEDRLTALFRARLIDHCVPEFRRIVGHVQHDQYHRFSVDAHILQALRELNRLRHRPKLAGKLSWVIKELTPAEWETLSFACLYHDIAKGRDGDHSVNGVSIAASDLAEFGKSDSLIEEVTWIVKEHLALSAAAFRENPRSPKTWNSLAERGVKGKRLRLLAAFTIVDIRATNPDAWTPWKETLLDELVKQLERPETGSLVSFAEQLRKQRLDAKWSEILDPFVIAAVPAKHLIEDIRAIGDVSEG